jgi:hypothetical protein
MQRRRLRYLLTKILNKLEEAEGTTVIEMLEWSGLDMRATLIESDLGLDGVVAILWRDFEGWVKKMPL